MNTTINHKKHTTHTNYRDISYKNMTIFSFGESGSSMNQAIISLIDYISYKNWRFFTYCFCRW